MGNVLGFNSRTPGGVRLLSLCVVLCSLWFQFTHPGRGATISESCFTFADRFQFTHPGRGATTDDACADRQEAVSIHAPREGCDELGDLPTLIYRTFQFTHPGRGATSLRSFSIANIARFNSRTPGGVRRSIFSTHSIPKRVSIHAPREGCDNNLIYFSTKIGRFNSRTPGGVRLVR